MEKLKEIDITEENLDIPVSEFVTNRIIELCEQRHFSMYHLCQVTGIAQSSLSYIRKGKILPTLTTLDKFCEGLSITVASTK